MIGKNIIRFEEISSTNDFIKENLDSLEDGTVVISKVQTKGRGRSNHAWQSIEGNLYVSILLKDTIVEPFEHVINASVSLIRLLENYGLKPYIKYPNDILVGHQKIAGILIERVISDHIDCVIGIGLNVNQVRFDELENKATSIKIQSKNHYDLNIVLSDLMKIYNEVLKEGFNSAFIDYISLSYVIGKYIYIDQIRYSIKEVQKDGSLLLLSGNKVKHVQMDEISLEELYHE